MLKKLLILALFILAIFAVFFFMRKNDEVKSIVDNNITRLVAKPTPSPTPIPDTHIIPLKTHVFQSFNNCGPASLSMALSYYGINKSQKELGDEIRPYQVPGGDNDDKSVTLEELADKAQGLGLNAYHRPNGTIDLLKKFIAADIPVITRTWATANEDIGHYRVVRGYDASQILQDDSLQNKNLWYSYSDFNVIWKKFNYEYLVLVPADKENLAKEIIGEDFEEKKSWEKAARNSLEEISINPTDVYARFNLSVAYYNTGDYLKSVEEFEKVENLISPRTLWYQIEPIKAYYELGRYDKVFEMTDRILNNQNRAFSELYIIRGNIYLRQNNKVAARQEFEKAILYNQNLRAAKDALASVQ